MKKKSLFKLIIATWLLHFCVSEYQNQLQSELIEKLTEKQLILQTELDSQSERLVYVEHKLIRKNN